MIIVSVSENKDLEKRISITPEISKKYINLGFEVHLSENYGEHLGIKDDEYKVLGVKIVSDEKKLLESADIIIQMSLLDENKTSLLQSDQIFVGVLNPYENKNKLDELNSEHSGLTALYKKTSYGLEKLGNADKRNREFKIFSEELNQISNHFGIQPRFIIAVLGMESFYGKNQGNIRTIEAVSTLAFDRRRSSFYKKQLFAALKIIDQGLVDSEKLVGSWGGAVGMTQMIPTTFIESGYDWDGDGVDIWNSYVDAFASTANYLTSIDKNPWSIDTTWGREVLPPKNI